MAEGFIERLEQAIEETKEAEKVTRIVYENVPYSEMTSVDHQMRGLGKVNLLWKRNYIVELMKAYIKMYPEISGTAPGNC